MRIQRSLVCVAGGILSIGSIAIAQDAAQPERSSVAMVEIKGTPADSPGPLDWLFPPEDATLHQLVTGLHEIADTKSHDAVVVRLKDAELGTTQIEELGVAITRLRSSGVKVYVFGEWFSSSDFMLGSYADTVICQEGGPVELAGLAMEEMYLADTLSWAGLKADMIQIGAYKGANEEMVNNKPSPEWDQNINQLLDSMYANLRAPILRGRSLTDASLDSAMEKLWMAEASDAKAAGLIDDAIDFPALTARIQRDLGKPVSWDMDAISRESAGTMDFSNPFAAMSMLTREPDNRPSGPTIAVLHIEGPIMEGDSSIGGFSGEASVGSRTIRNAIEDIIREEQIRGVIVRIDSPGGSATASEVMWQGLRRLAAKKPVWVSVGSMAASGGYYLAVGGDRIFVNPSSIVGSIGVVGGKISMDGLYDKLKVNVVTRTRGPRGGMFSSSPWTEAERGLVRGKMQETYDKFASRVAAGRKGADLSKIGEGRLFTGDKAVKLGMADEIGGLDWAITSMSTELNLEDYDVMDYPAPKSLPDVVQDFLSGVSASSPLNGRLARQASAAEISAVASQLFGPRAWPVVARQLDALSQLREEPVLLVSPRAIIIR
ncbi:MAG: S49 family peptidase [Phycisphaerales bacterium]